MRKIITLLIFVFVASWQLSAQNTPGCGDTFYDDGGATGDYSSNMNQTITISPDNAGDLVTVTFNSFDMEENWDYMFVYDGPDPNSPQISSGASNGGWTGGPGDPNSADGLSFTSSHSTGALTFTFTSDGSVQHSGWEAVVTCAPPPTCPAPSNLAVANAVATSADLSWTENGSATVWNVEYGPVGFAQGSGTVVAASSNPFTLTGLTAATSYDFYVQSDCGGGDLSTWSGPYSFSTGGTCGNFIVELIDSYGDGWNGGALTVYVNGSAVLSNITLDTGTGPESHAIPVNTGDIVSFEYVAGSWSGENEYIVYDNNGAVIADEGAGGATPGNIGDPSIPTGLEACPSCPKPSDLAVANIATDSADLSWTENGTATAWNIEYGPAGFTPGSGTTIAVSNNPYTLTGLTAHTSYDFYVQADCGGGDTSQWVGPMTFYTACDVVSSFPYNYGFEDISPNVTANWFDSCWSGNPENTNSGPYSGPFRWTAIDGATPSSSTGPSGAHNGSMYAYAEASGSNDGDVAEIVSPVFDMTSLTQPQLSFYYHMYGADMGSLSVDTFDGSTWTNDVWTVSGEQQSSDSDPWLEGTVTFANTVTQIRFRAIRGSGFNSDIAVDDVLIQEAPSCPHPSFLTVGNVTSDSAELSWTENGSATSWNIEYGPAGFAQGTGTVVAASSNPFTLTGLSPATEYDFYVQSDCGSGSTSSWEGAGNFLTSGTCGFFTVDLIDSWGDGWNGGTLTVYVNGTSTMTLTLANGNGPETHNIPVNQGDILSFEYTAGSFSTENQYIVYDNNGLEVANEGDNGTTPNSIGDPAVPTGLEACPTCPAPTDLAVSNETTTTVDLSWTENGSATAWNIEYGPAGFTPGQGTTVAVSSNPYTLTGLTAATFYEYYVQSDCGGGDLSGWEGPFPFVTPGTCGLYRVDLYDSYNDGWNGGLLTIFINGAVTMNITMDTGSGPESYYIPVNINDILSFDYTPGYYATENEYVVYDNNNVMVADEGVGSDEPGDIGDPSIPNGMQACPTCPAPSDLSVANIGPYSVDLSWVENGSATAWNVEYGSVGFTPGQGTVVPANSNPFTLTGLSQYTSYEYYVQADCGGGDTSLWEGPYSFTTICDPQLPYTQDFDTSLDCWTVEDTNADGITWLRDTGATPISCSAGNGDYVMYVRFNNTQNMDDWLFSPGFNLQAGVDYALLFSYGNDGSSAFEEDMDVYISTGATSTDALNGTQIFSETGIVDGCNQFSNFNITVSTDGIYYFGFHGKSAAAQDVLMIDDFVLDTASAVNELTNVTGIYPNPTTGEFVIKSHDLNNAEVFVYSMTGKEIYHSTIDNDNYTINLNNVQKGVYFVKVTSDNKSYTSKLIIK